MANLDLNQVSALAAGLARVFRLAKDFRDIITLDIKKRAGEGYADSGGG
jgi:hypothetical protein